MNLDIDKMTIGELKDFILTLVKTFIYEHDRVTDLQDRVLKLETQDKSASAIITDPNCT